MQPLITITLRLMQRGLNKPFTGPGYTVKLYDRDLVEDDLLGQGHPDQEGRVSITFDPRLMQTADSPFETRPDLYFLLLKHDTPIFESELLRDVDFESVADFDVKEGVHWDMGVFLI